MEILILHPGGLGDILLSLPALNQIRHAYSTARITLAGNLDHLAAIVSDYVDSIVSLSSLPLHRLYAEKPVPETDANFWKTYDWVISWTGSGNPVFEANFARLHSNVRIGRWRPERGETRHVSQLFVDSLEMSSNADVDMPFPWLRIKPGLQMEGIRWLKAGGWNGQDRVIALHPGAGSWIKRWPLPRFIALAQSLARQEETKLLLIGGPAEPDLAQQMARSIPEASAFRADSMSLSKLSAVLAQCRAFVGNDSGIAHLSAALGLRSVVLFGPTLPRHWAPRGNHVTVLRNTSGCEACVSHSTSHACLENITPADVLGAVSPISIFPA